MNKLIRNRAADRTFLNTRWLTLILGIIAIGAATKALASNSTQLLAEELAQEKNADFIIGKPFDVHKLKEAIKSLLS